MIESKENGRGYYWSFVVMGTVVQFYRHDTVHDAIHHQHVMRTWKPDKTGYVSHRATWANMQDYAHEMNWIIHPKCIPEK